MSVTQEELILRMMPFSPAIREWFTRQPDLAAALKFLNVERFIALGGIVVSASPLKPEDEVIGFFVYDYRQRKGQVKQDFIVNVGGLNKEFVLYTALPVPRYGKHVKHINEFDAVYGGNGRYYVGVHHPEPETLPTLLAQRLERAMILAQKRIDYGRPVIKTQQELNNIDRQLRRLGK